MLLENLVVDAVDPRRLGAFWQAALGAERLTDEPDLVELRLSPPGGPLLDLCLPRVPTAPTDPVRLHLDLHGGDRQGDVVERLLSLGARHLDVGQGAAGEVAWVVLADPEGNPFCVMEERAAYVDTGPVAALPLHSSDPDRDAAFWSWLTGWTEVDGVDRTRLRSLRHPSRQGPLLELCPEASGKVRAKNRLHLDVRLDAGQDPAEVAAGIVARGGHVLEHDWGPVPWQVFTDPSGNELCVLPATRG